jgi:hypothetical protein
MPPGRRIVLHRVHTSSSSQLPTSPASSKPSNASRTMASMRLTSSSVLLRRSLGKRKCEPVLEWRGPFARRPLTEAQAALAVPAKSRRRQSGLAHDRRGKWARYVGPGSAGRQECAPGLGVTTVSVKFLGECALYASRSKRLPFRHGSAARATGTME